MKSFLKSFIKSKSINDILSIVNSSERISVSSDLNKPKLQKKSVLVLEMMNQKIELDRDKDILYQIKINSTDLMNSKLNNAISYTHPDCIVLIGQINIEPVEYFIPLKEPAENVEEFYDEIAFANEYYYNKNISLTKSKISRLKEQAKVLANRFPNIIVFPLLFNSADQMLYLITESNLL